MNASRRALLIATLGLAGAELAGSRPASAASASEINQEASQALHQLYATHPKARELGSKAIAILVFPRIYKGGFVIGGESGDGVMWIKGRPAGYYNLSAASFGLQAGGQRFSYALFFMTEGAVKYLQSSNGWSIGSGPSVVVVNKAEAASVTSTTLTHDVYAFPFGEHGLMAGLGLEGSKITRITPS